MCISLVVLYWFLRRSLLLAFLSAFVCGMCLMPAKWPHRESATIMEIVAEPSEGKVDVLTSGRIVHYRHVISLIMERPLAGWGRPHS